MCILIHLVIALEQKTDGDYLLRLVKEANEFLAIEDQ